MFHNHSPTVPHIHPIVVLPFRTSCLRSRLWHIFSQCFSRPRDGLVYSRPRMKYLQKIGMANSICNQATLGAGATADATTFFLGCVARPFFSSRGMTSVALLRLMFFRQTGHCERFVSWGPVRFSPAMRASMRQVWQKRWPGIVKLADALDVALERKPTTSSSSEIGRIIHADDTIKRVERGNCLFWLGLRLDSIGLLFLQCLL